MYGLQGCARIGSWVCHTTENCPSAWNYFQSVENPVNTKFVADWKAYAKKHNLPGADKAVTGIFLWVAGEVRCRADCKGCAEVSKPWRDGDG
jgi:hypothetical protein